MNNTFGRLPAWLWLLPCAAPAAINGAAPKRLLRVISGIHLELLRIYSMWRTHSCVPRRDLSRRLSSPCNNENIIMNAASKLSRDREGAVTAYGGRIHQNSSLTPNCIWRIGVDKSVMDAPCAISTRLFGTPNCG